MPTPPRVTIAEIAERAQTSVSTVSKVLNGRPRVSDARRDEILALLKEAGYQRRGAGLKRPSGLFDVVLPDMVGLWAGHLLAGAEREASRQGVSLVVNSSHGRTLGNRHWLERFKSRGSDGILILAARIKETVQLELPRLAAPCVMVDAMGSAPVGVPAIGATNLSGSIDAVQHLLDLGHTRIGVITGPMDLPYSEQRLSGYRSAISRGGINFDSRLVRYGMFDVDSGYRWGGELLDLRPRPTAIFAGSDLHAHGVYRAARERGLSIPEDLSVVGFDGIESCDWVSPRLTTVSQPLEEMAVQAMRLLIDMAHNGVAPAVWRFELNTWLVVRESTAPPAS